MTYTPDTPTPESQESEAPINPVAGGDAAGQPANSVDSLPTQADAGPQPIPSQIPDKIPPDMARQIGAMYDFGPRQGGQPPEVGQPRPSPAEDAIAAAEGKKRNAGGLFHHLFDSLAGYNIKMDDNGEMVPVQRKGTGAIMRGIVAGAITGMASAEDSKGGFMQGFAAGAKGRQTEIMGQNLEMQRQNSAAFQRQKEIYELNLHTALNQAQIEDLHAQAGERAMKMWDEVAKANRAILAGKDDADENQGGLVDREGVTSEELQEGMKSGKFHAGDHIGTLVRVEPGEDGQPKKFYSVERDGPIDVTPKMYDQLATVNPDAFPPNVSDSAKTFTAKYSTLTHQVQDGVAKRGIPSNYLGSLKETVAKIDPKLASDMPDYDSNPQLYKDLYKARQFISGAGGSVAKAVEQMSKMFYKDPQSGNDIPTWQSRLASKLTLELGGGDPVKGGQIIQKAIDAEDALRAEAKTKLTEQGKKIDDTKAKQIESEFENLPDHGGHSQDEYNVAKGIIKKSIQETGGKAANVKVNVINTEAKNVGKIAEVSGAKAGANQFNKDIAGQRQWYTNNDEQAATDMDVSKLDPNSPPALLAEGKITLEQLSKRTNNFNAAIQVANKYMDSKAQSSVDWAKRSSDFKYASNVTTQNTLKYLNSLTGHDNKSGNLGELIKESDKITRTSFPAVNDVAAWARLQSGDPEITKFHAATVEVADQIGKILAGGGTGSVTSDAKLKQAQELFQTGFNKDQVRGNAQILRDLLGNRKSELVGNNEFLQKWYGGASKPSGGGNVAPDGTVVNTPKGRMVKQNGQWVPQQ